MESLAELKTSKYEDKVHDQVLKQHHSGFQPYVNNGGDIVAIAGQDYVAIACDTRLKKGYEIMSRDQSKLFKINDRVILGSGGCWCDVVTFSRILEMRAKMYRYDHNQELSCQSAAQLVQTMLYNRRFFPYYVNNVVAGIDENGKGHVYSYDPVGSLEETDYISEGNSASLIQPYLDSQVGKKNLEGETYKDLTLDEALKIIKDAFTSAAERNINCGDYLHINVLTKDGIREEKILMRKD